MKVQSINALEAREKICPILGNIKVGVTGYDDIAKCKSSDCMAWVWANQDKTKGFCSLCQVEACL